MGFMNELSGSERGWLRNTVAAGVLAAFMLPGSALATAECSVQAEASLGFEFGGDILFIDAFELEHDAFADTTGPAATAFVTTDDYQLTPDAPFVQMEFAATGTADRSFPGDSESNAGVVSRTGMIFENTGGQDADIFPIFNYEANGSISTADPVNEIAGATVDFILIVEINNNPTELVNDFMALPGTGSPVGGSFLDPITLGPGEQAFVDLLVDMRGLAIALELDQSVVPVPATLALLGLGLIGFAGGQRQASAT